MQIKTPNPKDAAAQTKAPVHVFPLTAILGGSMALFDGLLKYGLANYRATEVNASVYYAAGLRHLMKWYAGEDLDVDWQLIDGEWVDCGSGMPNTWHAIACVAILIDAEAAGALVDDREYPSGFLEMMRTKSSEVQKLRSKHANRNPKHYDRRDAPKMTDVRETARQFLIERGAAYFKSVLARANVSTFSELPDAVLAELAEESNNWVEPSDLTTDPAWRELIRQE